MTRVAEPATADLHAGAIADARGRRLPARATYHDTVALTPR